ncbi:MAG: hypothetical protein O2895_04915 [Chloroflexi bacterium]|nr:hypothetical protein [Chloroflexota bacterium]
MLRGLRMRLEIESGFAIVGAAGALDDVVANRCPIDGTTSPDSMYPPNRSMNERVLLGEDQVVSTFAVQEVVAGVVDDVIGAE